MKLFGSPGYLLANSRLEVKAIYSFFLVFVAIGMATMAILEAGRIGFSLEGVATHFRGGDYAGEMRFARTFGELVELTHFHAFILGTIYLILAHLFIATRIPAWLRWACVVGTAAALLLDLASVWLVRYVSAAFAALLLASWIGEWLGMAALVAVPLVEMWRPAAPAGDDD